MRKDDYYPYYKQLDGATIDCYAGMYEDEPLGVSFPQFRVTLADGTKILLEVSSDEEGNGGGFLFGLPRP